MTGMRILLCSAPSINAWRKALAARELQRTVDEVASVERR
jgi:hypothetical protein